MIFKSEGDVRDWVRMNAGRRVFWVEAARGGTDGLQDCLIRFGSEIRGKLIPVELKVGLLTADGSCLRFKWRAGQKQVVRRMAETMIDEFVLVGDLMGGVLWAARGCDAIKETVKVTGEFTHVRLRAFTRITIWEEFEAFVEGRI
jgi:hypothetical protein